MSHLRQSWSPEPGGGTLFIGAHHKGRIGTLSCVFFFFPRRKIGNEFPSQTQEKVLIWKISYILIFQISVWDAYPK